MNNPVTIAMALAAKLRQFVEEECIPAEEAFEAELKATGQRWGAVPSIMAKLKERAK